MTQDSATQAVASVDDWAAHVVRTNDCSQIVGNSWRYLGSVFEYVTLQPGGEMGRFVELIWFARGHITGASELIAPTGSTVAAVVLGDAIRLTVDNGESSLVADTGFLIGPHDRPLVNEPLGETYCVGIVATPVGCRPCFGLAPAALRGRVVDLTDGWTRAPALRRELARSQSAAAALEVVASTLRVPEPFDREAVARCEAAIEALSADPTHPVADIAAGLGVSHGHLDRQFTEQVGLSPRTLARILRLRRLLDHIDVYESVTWANLASELGWFDQAHLIRDFKRHTGVTPAAYAAAQQSTYDRTEAAASAGFVPRTR